MSWLVDIASRLWCMVRMFMLNLDIFGLIPNYDVFIIFFQMEIDPLESWGAEVVDIIRFDLLFFHT